MSSEIPVMLNWLRNCLNQSAIMQREEKVLCLSAQEFSHALCELHHFSAIR
jgi:hypothetical protein